MFAAAASLSPVDWAVIAVYLIGIITLGLWLGRGQKTTRDFFLGGRDLPWWGVALSIVATETSALTFIGVPAMLFAKGGNLGFIQVVFGYAIGRILLAIVMVPIYFKNEIYSPYALIGNAFGPGAHKTAAGLFLVAGTLAAGVDPTGYGAALPGFGDQRNFELLREADFTPQQVVQIMSANGAKLLDIYDETGSIEVGKLAELVLLEGDLAADPAVIKNVTIVFKDGVGYDSPALLESIKGQVGIH